MLYKIIKNIKLKFPLTGPVSLDFLRIPFFSVGSRIIFDGPSQIISGLYETDEEGTFPSHILLSCDSNLLS